MTKGASLQYNCTLKFQQDGKILWRYGHTGLHYFLWLQFSFFKNNVIAIIHCQQAWTYFYKFGKVCTVATRKYCKPKYLWACFQNFKINNSQNIIPFNKKCILSHVYNSKCHCKQLCNLSSSLYYSYIWTQALEIPYLLSQVLWLLQMFFNGNWSRMSPLSGNNEQVILAQICELKLEVMQVKGHEEM